VITIANPFFVFALLFSYMSQLHVNIYRVLSCQLHVLHMAAVPSANFLARAKINGCMTPCFMHESCVMRILARAKMCCRQSCCLDQFGFLFGHASVCCGCLHSTRLSWARNTLPGKIFRSFVIVTLAAVRCIHLRGGLCILARAKTHPVYELLHPMLAEFEVQARCAAWGGRLIEANGGPHHVYLLIELPPRRHRPNS